MGLIRINGTTDPVKQPTEVVYDPRSGYTTTLSYECAGENLWGIAGQFQALRYNFSLTSSPARSRIIAQASGSVNGQAEVTIDTWQILANELQKSILDHPKLAALAAADDVQYRALRLAISNPALDLTTAAAQLAVTLPGTLNADITSAFNVAKRGATHYALTQYVLRHTTNVSNSFGGNISDANVGSIYTTPKLLTEVTNSNLWVFPMPGRLQTKLNAIVAPVSASGYQWGWRKLASSETSAANSRVDINTEYHLEQWSTWVYPLAP